MIRQSIRSVVGIGLSALLLACVSAAAGVGVPPSDYGGLSPNHVPIGALDGSCSYARPMLRSETLAAYVTNVADPARGERTDLDCFAAGAVENPPRGMSPRYHFANASLRIREWSSIDAALFEQLLSDLQHTSATGEILFLLATAAPSVACAQRLAVAAHRAGIIEGSEYWGALEASASRHPSRDCLDQRVLQLISQSEGAGR